MRWCLLGVLHLVLRACLETFSRTFRFSGAVRNRSVWSRLSVLLQAKCWLIMPGLAMLGGRGRPSLVLSPVLLASLFGVQRKLATATSTDTSLRGNVTSCYRAWRFYYSTSCCVHSETRDDKSSHAHKYKPETSGEDSKHCWTSGVREAIKSPELWSMVEDVSWFKTSSQRIV